MTCPVISPQKSIALIGFRGTGKTHVGRLLAGRLRWSFLDMDVELVRSRGESIAQWVEREGWQPFREAESRLLAQLAREQRCVVATGGGVVLDASNRNALQQAFCTVWLQASAETICRRLAADAETSAAQRPALTALDRNEEVRRVLEERHPLYAASAHLIVSTEGLTVEEVAACILNSSTEEPTSFRGTMGCL